MVGDNCCSIYILCMIYKSRIRPCYVCYKIFLGMSLPQAKLYPVPADSLWMTEKMMIRWIVRLFTALELTFATSKSCDKCMHVETDMGIGQSVPPTLIQTQWQLSPGLTWLMLSPRRHFIACLEVMPFTFPTANVSFSKIVARHGSDTFDFQNI